MRIVVDINHPGQVHYFKNFIRDVRAHGHEVLVTASEKEITFRLLRDYGLDFVPLGSYGNTLAKKALNIPRLDLKMYAAVRKFRPDVFLGFGSIKNAHVSRLMRKPAIAFDDTEPSPVEHMLYVPFTDAILTPSCFRKDFGRKHIRYDGYIELAYLHPDYFRPTRRCWTWPASARTTRTRVCGSWAGTRPTTSATPASTWRRSGARSGSWRSTAASSSPPSCRCRPTWSPTG